MTKLASDSLHGVLPALPVPFTDNQEIDLQGLQKLLCYVLDEGVQGLWILGSSGEFTALSTEEKRLIIELTVKQVAGRVPVIVGVGANTLRDVVRNAEEAWSLGADACSVLLPFFFVPDEIEAIRFLREVAQAVPLPVIIYDIPSSTKVKLDPSTFLELSDSPNIIGFKDSSSDFARFQYLLLGVREKTTWKLFQGDERFIGSSLLWGADGVVAALGSIAPGHIVKLYEAARKGNIETTLLIQKKLISLFKLFELKGGPTDGAFFAGLKAALQVLGICGRAVSHPFSPMPEDKMPDVERLLRECEVSIPKLKSVTGSKE